LKEQDDEYLKEIGSKVPIDKILNLIKQWTDEYESSTSLTNFTNINQAKNVIKKNVVTLKKDFLYINKFATKISHLQQDIYFKDILQTFCEFLNSFEREKNEERKPGIMLFYDYPGNGKTKECEILTELISTKKFVKVCQKNKIDVPMELQKRLEKSIALLMTYNDKLGLPVLKFLLGNFRARIVYWFVNSISSFS
jgi:hypothetical protein